MKFAIFSIFQFVKVILSQMSILSFRINDHKSDVNAIDPESIQNDTLWILKWSLVLIFRMTFIIEMLKRIIYLFHKVKSIEEIAYLFDCNMGQRLAIKFMPLVNENSKYVISYSLQIYSDSIYFQ